METFYTVVPPKRLVYNYKAGVISEEQYTVEYNKLLKNNTYDIITELHDLRRKHEGKAIILTCYEKTGDFCHRHLLSKFLNDLKGFEWVTELFIFEPTGEVDRYYL